MRRSMAAAMACVALSSGVVLGDTFNLASDWSETSNPMGRWTLREDASALPHVDAWQRNLGGWGTFQPGWARSEDDNTRLPFFFRSNGTEQFACDFVQGDIVVHTWDGVNGVGSGQASVAFDVGLTGTVSVSGSAWMGRDIGRAADWELRHNGALLSAGSLFSGDAFSRNTPFDLSAGSGGAAAVTNIPVIAGDTIELRLVTRSSFGDFVGLNLSISNVPAPGVVSLLAMSVLAAARRRR